MNYFINYCSFFGIILTKPYKGLFEALMESLLLNECINELFDNLLLLFI